MDPLRWTGIFAVACLVYLATYFGVRFLCSRLGPIIGDALRLARGGCRHQWELAMEDGRPLVVAVVVEGIYASEVGEAMSACWMRTCTKCLRTEVAQLRRGGRTTGRWSEVMRMTEEDRHHIQANFGPFAVGSVAPQGSPVVRKLK